MIKDFPALNFPEREKVLSGCWSILFWIS